MTHAAYEAIQEYRKAVKSLIGKYAPFSQELTRLSIQASEKDTPAYSHDTAIVYNSAWDSITEESEIKLIVVGDNPGKEEQLADRRAYLVGQSGRVAEGFFRRNGELAVDFRKNVLITNKTPIHTAKTKHLRYLAANGGPEISEAIQESQLFMARETARLHQRLHTECGTKLYLVGYAELKEKGIFTAYRDELKNSYHCSEAWDAVFTYQHFSMNRFLIDLKSYMAESGESDTAKALDALGRHHRKEIFQEGR